MQQLQSHCSSSSSSCADNDGDTSVTSPHFSQDIEFLLNVSLKTFQSHLTMNSDTLTKTVALLFSRLLFKQSQFKKSLRHRDYKSCITIANNFVRTSEQCDKIFHKCLRGCDFRRKSVDNLRTSASEVVTKYREDAIYAAQMSYVFVFELAREYFDANMKEHFENNKPMKSLLNFMDDCVCDYTKSLHSSLLVSAMAALVSATVSSYVKFLVTPVSTRPRWRKPFFSDVEKAITVMHHDVQTMKNYYNRILPTIPEHVLHVQHEFEFLHTVIHIMQIAAGFSHADLSESILFIYQSLSDFTLTKHLIGDLYQLINPTDKKNAWYQVDVLENKMHGLTTRTDECTRDCWFGYWFDPKRVPGLRVDEVLADLYFGGRRKLPPKRKPWRRLLHKNRRKSV